MRDGPANIRGVLVLAAAGYLLFLPLWMALVSAFRRKRKMLWAVIPLPIYIVLVTALAFPLFHPSIHRVGTDAELEPLKGSARLSILLVGGEVTDAGLEHLNGLPQLKELYLFSTAVTDAGLIHLKGLNALRKLCISGTPITDSGLKHLEGLTQLEGLSFAETRVTEDGVRNLRRALPKCELSGGRQHRASGIAEP